MQFVGEKWEIELYPIAGCVVSQKLVDSAATANNKVWKKMDRLHGVDSKKKFRKEAISEMKKIMEVQNIFESDRRIKKRIKRIKKIKESTISNLENVSIDGNIYYWTIYSFESKNNPDYIWKPEFKVGVNLSRRKVEIIALE